MKTNRDFILPLESATLADVARVGGKNASLGEMINRLSNKGIRVPGGFAITVDGYREFLEFNDLEQRLAKELDRLEVSTLGNLADVGKACRERILAGMLSPALKKAIAESYDLLDGGQCPVAVRSSATAEDSPTASFAGQHESFLNQQGIEEVCKAVIRCYASLFNDRAIKYRIDNGFGHMQVGLSVGVQRMVRSDKGSAGVTFTIEPENGNHNLVYITGAWGLGEAVVQGAVNTDEFYLFKPAIKKGKDGLVSKRLGSKDQMMVYSPEGKPVLRDTPPDLRDQYVLDEANLAVLGRWSSMIEDHYGVPMDIEWAKDGMTSELYIVQARPETVHSRNTQLVFKEYRLDTKQAPLLRGKAVGKSIVSGRVCIINSLADAPKVQKGDIIVADITNPDWNALLKKGVSIVTNKGGRTSHASIIARELGIPAVVGTHEATAKLHDGQVITVSCASGDEGHVYDTRIEWKEKDIPVEKLSRTKTRPMLILADPQKALRYAAYPNEGVGLLRLEFTINNSVQVHPMALVKYDDLPETAEKKQIEALTRHYTDKKQFFISKLAESVGLVAAAFYPREVIVRMSDFKTNEYGKLLGGRSFEPEEENPMLGFRGASRYYNPRYREGFGLECAAIRHVREKLGLDNVKVMIPFCRTVEEGRKVLEVMREFGLERGRNGLKVYVMAEIPSNILLAEQFAELFDGFSIGSNDLTQLTLGLDRDSAIVSDLFNERDPAVTGLISRLITVAHEKNVEVGLCGQAPSDYPEFARLLVNCGIDSISFNADALINGISNIVEAERGLSQKLK